MRRKKIINNKGDNRRKGKLLTLLGVRAWYEFVLFLEQPGARVRAALGPQALVDANPALHPVGRGVGDDNGQVGQHQEHQADDGAVRCHGYQSARVAGVILKGEWRLECFATVRHVGTFVTLEIAIPIFFFFMYFQNENKQSHTTMVSLLIDFLKIKLEYPFKDQKKKHIIKNKKNTFLKKKSEYRLFFLSPRNKLSSKYPNFLPL